MEINMTDLLNSITEDLSRIDYIKPNEIPNIDLYMDQVTTFMDEHLAGTKRHSEDKILTKTMINNYSKNNLLPPSVKKKYSKDHVLLLIFIYYFKNILSIKDIETLLSPLRDKYFSDESTISLSELYREVCELEKSRLKPLSESVQEAYESSFSAFSNIEDNADQNELRLFAFICSLSFDVYLRKVMIEKIVDELALKNEEPKKNGKDKFDRK